MKDVNLKSYVVYSTNIWCINRLSDHTLGIEVPIAAVAIEAKIIEKHFTLSRTLRVRSWLH
jgi:sialic acid synthase SpsE